MGDSMDDDFVRRIERIRRRLEEDIDRFIDEIEREASEIESIVRPGYDLRGRIVPLYSIQDLGDAIKILVDMPDLDEGSLNIDVERNILHIRGRMRRGVRISSWTMGDNVEFSEYEADIDLPIEVPSKSKIRSRLIRGFLEIIIYKY